MCSSDPTWVGRGSSLSERRVITVPLSFPATLEQPVCGLITGRPNAGRKWSSPLSSRGLGRRPLTAETRVRIPVAVLQNPRAFGGFCVLGVVRHSLRHSRDRCGRLR